MGYAHLIDVDALGPVHERQPVVHEPQGLQAIRREDEVTRVLVALDDQAAARGDRSDELEVELKPIASVPRSV